VRCSLIEEYRCFRGVYCFNLHIRRRENPKYRLKTLSTRYCNCAWGSGNHKVAKVNRWIHGHRGHSCFICGETLRPFVVPDVKVELFLPKHYIDHVGGIRRLRTAGTNGPIVHPLVICDGGEPWWWCRLGKTPDSSTRAVSKSHQQRHLGASRRNGRRSENFACQCQRYVKACLTCQILRHGASGFTSHPKEGVLRILIALKNHCLDRVWTRDPLVQWQAHYPLHHWGV
jgi:hypothetical protein